MIKYAALKDVTTLDVARSLFIEDFYSDDSAVYKKVYGFLAEAGDLTYDDSGLVAKVNIPPESPLLAASWLKEELQ